MTTTPKGFTQIDATQAPNGPAQINAAELFVENLIGESVATSSALPSSGNWPGRIITAKDTGVIWVNLDGLVNWRPIGGQVAARVRTSTAQTTSNTTPSQPTPVIWDTTDYNYGSVWSSSQKTRLTAPVKGIYRVSANLAYSTNSYPGGVQLAKNGTDITDTQRWAAQSTAAYAYPSINTDLLLNANDYIEVQSLGGAPSLALNLVVMHASISLVTPL